MGNHNCGPKKQLHTLPPAPWCRFCPKRRKECQRGLLFFFGEMLGVTLFEFLNSPGGIDQLLLTGKKRVTLRTDLNLDLVENRAHLKGGATSAGSRYVIIFRMYAVLHCRVFLQHSCCVLSFTIIASFQRRKITIIPRQNNISTKITLFVTGIFLAPTAKDHAGRYGTSRSLSRENPCCFSDVSACRSKSPCSRRDSWN